MNVKKTYLAFLLFLLILTITLSGLLINKTLKNKSTDNIRYMKTTINNTSEDKLAMAQVKKANITITNTQSEETPVILTYTYKIKIENVTGSFKYKQNEVEKSLVFNQNNEATFTLNSNDEIIIYDIPTNNNYTIEQSTNKEYRTINSGDSTNIYNGIVKEENNIEFKNISSIVTTNPNTTSSNIINLVLLDTLILLVLIFLKKTKIQRYETN